MHVLTRIHKSHHRLICIWTHVVRTHKCLCPCECSHLEPLCIHTYVTSIHIFHHRHFCISTRAVHSHTCTCHCECSQLEPLCIHAYTHKHTYVLSQILLYMNRCDANSQMVVPLRVLTLGISLYTYICSQVYIFHITDTFENDSVLCELTYVCARASAHTLRLKTSLYTYIYILTCKVEMTLDLMCAGKWRGPHSWLVLLPQFEPLASKRF